MGFFFSTLCLQVGNRLGFWGGFSCFVSFIWCQLDWLGQPFFICHQHLWFGLSFFATGICGLFFLSLPQALVNGLFLSWPFLLRLFVFALLALVSGYQCISQFLVSCCALAAHQLHHWRFELEFFPSRLPCPTNSALKQTPFGIPHKIYEIALSEVLATQMGVTEAQHKSQLVWIVQIWPIFASQRVGSAGNRGFLVWIACELLQFAATQ